MARNYGYGTRAFRSAEADRKKWRAMAARAAETDRQTGFGPGRSEIAVIDYLHGQFVLYTREPKVKVHARSPTKEGLRDAQDRLIREGYFIRYGITARMRRANP